jgi:hypothetical protein
MKLVILGGYGTFGGRLVRLIADLPVEILVAGRDLDAATAFCATVEGRARLRPVRLDRRDIAPLLARERPDLVVDASGPFQAYGADPYRVPQAAVAAGADYLDLADGANFVAGIGTLDAEARAAGRFVLAGMSSFPVLTAAVLAEMSREMHVTGLVAGIAPSPFAGVGLNVLRAVLGYAGRPVRLLRGGRVASARALVSSRRATVGPPGGLPLRNLRFSLVDVPDLAALPAAFPELADVWVGAAPQPALLHGLLSALAWLRLPLAPLAPLAAFVLNRFAWGEHRGGMIVQGSGTREGAPAVMSWHMLAEGEDGPFIPSMAAEALIRKLVAGTRPAPGARAGIGALTLDDYRAVFAGRAITEGWRRPEAGAPLYRQLLGPAFAALPPTVQRLHEPGAHAEWSGRAEVTRGTSPLAGLVARLFGFPEAGVEVPVTVRFSTDATGRETWERRFGGRVMRSTQEAGRGRRAHLMVERFGPFAFALALVAEGGRLRLVNRGWRLLGLPLPRALMPGGAAWEEEAEGRFRFHVEITLPLAGRVVRYRGWLEPRS